MDPDQSTKTGLAHPCRAPFAQQGWDFEFRKTWVAVIGGGLAGLACACALADSGFEVTLFERRPYLGGRASSYEHPGTGEVVDNCQHVLFGSCTNLIAFYRTIGILDKIRWFDRMTFIEPGGRQSELEPTSLPAPLHVTPSFLKFKFLDLRDKITLGRALAVLMMHIPKDDGTSFEGWLLRHGQTHRSIERFWKPILVSALSEDIDRISVPYAAQVVRESMNAPFARRMGIPTIPLTHLYDAASAYITARGGLVKLRSAVQEISVLDSGTRVRTQESEELFDYAVLAVPFDSAGKLLTNIPRGDELREKISHFETSPITGVHLWFDRKISDLPHAILLDRTIQWMFHKSLLLESHPSNIDGKGTTSIVPNSAPKDAARRTTSGDTPSYVELVISSSKSLINKSRQEIIDLALNELREFFPAAHQANLVKGTVIKEVNATFSPRPGIDEHRPANTTPWPRLFIAGDWTASGWPATMEGAVRSGFLAAEALTTHNGMPKKFLVDDLQSTGLMRLL